MVVLKDVKSNIWKRRLQFWLIIKKNDDNSYGEKDPNDWFLFFTKSDGVLEEVVTVVGNWRKKVYILINQKIKLILYIYIYCNTSGGCLFF